MNLYRIDAAGNPVLIGYMERDDQGRYRVTPADDPVHRRLLLGQAGDGVFDDLPYFLLDLTPRDDYAGLPIVHQLTKQPLFQREFWPHYWGEPESLLRYLSQVAVDSPGDLAIGDEAVERIQRQRRESATLASYPALADQVEDHWPLDQYIGGAQPKFLARLDEREVIVKFSPGPAGANPYNSLWADLLVAEHLALETLDDAGVPAARSRLHQFDDRIFLELDRFDRTANGRLPVISLRALDPEFVGAGSGWTRILADLERQGWISDETLATGTFIDDFGRWIENTDRHTGNLALCPQRNGTLALAPVYDMLPMRHHIGYREDYRRPEGNIEDAPAQAALAFWRRVAEDSRISERFREIADNRVEALNASTTLSTRGP
jgi:hypothetical protein